MYLIPETVKVSLIKLLLFRYFSLCSDFIKSHHEIDKLKSILYKNSYLRGLVDKCIQNLLDKILTPKPVVSAVPKLDLVIALLYLGKLSLRTRTRINRIMKIISRTVISDLFSTLNAKLITFLHLKTKFHRFYVPELFADFIVVVQCYLAVQN